ncbi:MAG: phosphoribosyltransferase family protein [Elusimicrobia bacterium]|nr:phosphoribosyltransferase family protein [Elusimicrobiota bacterium]
MFHDRHDAAVRLLRKLQGYRGRRDALVLAIPRGGLPIGGLLARELGLPLDVILTKKIGHPYNPEFAIGAVSLTGETLDEALAAREGIPADWISAEIARIREQLRERYRLYHGAGKPLPVAGKTVILTDDGAATGRTLLVAIELLRREGAAKIVAAIPVAPPETVELLEARADEVVCLEVPSSFMAIGEFYGDFSQVSDQEAAAILRKEGAWSSSVTETR